VRDACALAEPVQKPSKPAKIKPTTGAIALILTSQMFLPTRGDPL
jgi:hypothetical protein